MDFGGKECVHAFCEFPPLTEKTLSLTHYPWTRDTYFFSLLTALDLNSQQLDAAEEAELATLKVTLTDLYSITRKTKRIYKTYERDSFHQTRKGQK